MEKIQGVEVIRDFISTEKEAEILKHLKPSFKTQGNGRNLIKRYGSTLPYNSHIRSAELPEFILDVINELREKGIIDADHVTVNEYKKGQKISPHIDSKKSGPVIVVLSVLSDAVMVLSKDKQEEKVELPRRSLVILKDEARNIYKHSILPVKEDRWSIVFRKGTI
jgi:alkylated DNA repair dioxygenase AlkB